MSNLILKQGDFVKVKALTGELRHLGLSSGAVLCVETLGLDGALGVRTWRGALTLVDSRGALTDACLDVARCQGPNVALVKGLGQG
jgi:hypothetical protein